MINALLSGLLKILMTIVTYVVGIILSPIYALVVVLFPDVSSYLSTFTTFLSDYLFKGLAFAREVFFNLTGFPRPLLNLVVTFFLARILYSMGIHAIKFVINMYHIIRGAKTSSAD